VHLARTMSTRRATRICRAGGLFIVVDGEAAVVVDGQDRGRLGPGSFFGEISVLLDEPATVEIAARTRLTCLLVPAGSVERLLADHGGLALAMLRTQSRRLQTANQWRV
jgi:CRP-like cAMP-binding protein